jgi:uncharacterized protein YggE
MKYFIFLLAILMNGLAWGQNTGNSNYHETVMHQDVAKAEVTNQEATLLVSGMLNAKAETFVGIFNVKQVGESVETTDALMTARVRKFKHALVKSGIDTSAVHTDMVSFVPKYDFNVINKLFSKTYNEVPDGFELQKNVIIRYKRISELDAIVTAAASAEIYDLVKVDYFVQDVKKQYDELRLKCMEILKERIKSYEAVGMKLDTLPKTFAEDFGTILPQHRYTEYQAVARPSIEAVKRSTSGTSLKFRSADLSPSRYYEAISYEGYDVVINPVVYEPMVQLTYQIKIKFKYKSNEQNNFLILGPAGQLQRLDLKIP